MNHERIETLLDEMTLEEQVALLAGADFWTTVPIPRLGIPAIKVSDGPNGARGGGALVGGVKAACFPAGIALGATWNTELIAQIGQALADEARSKGARALLAPTVNLHRSTLNGRNFECYSEDPLLSARIAIAYIQGLQSNGVSATVKHYVGNESEFERNTINSEIDERPLRELYLVPFEAAVKEAGTWALMSSYNRINGVYASENRRTLIEILRDEWGFDGVVMSDWFGMHSTVEAANDGVDLEMPGPTRYRGAQLVAAVHEGKVSPDTIREHARRILHWIERVGAFDDPTIAEEQAIDRPEHRALIRRAGAEGVVLLKNDAVLPLDPNGAMKLAIIGPNAKTAQIMGGGSAQVNAHYRVTPFEGIQAQIGDRIEPGYEPGCTNYRHLPLLRGDRISTVKGEPGLTVEYFNSSDLSGDVVFSRVVPDADLMWFNEVAPGVDPMQFSARFSTRFSPEESGEHQFGLVSAGKSRLFVNGALVVDNWDAWQPGDSYFGSGSAEAIGTIDLAADQPCEVVIEYSSPEVSALGVRAIRVGATRPLGDDAIERAAALAAASDVTLVFVGLNGEWESEGADRPHMDLVGRQNELVSRVAAANPRTVVVLQTGSPVTMPWLDQVAGVLQAWFPGQECGNAIADVLFGAINPAGRLPQTFPVRLEDNPAFLNYPGENGRVRYGEGLFIGYRYYDRKRITPLFAFGHGLSYTSFSYDHLQLSASTIEPGDRISVSVDVTNTGARDGQEVVQVYVRDQRASLSRPEKELKGFAKVAIAAGETRSVTIPLDMRSFAFYDDARAAWVAEAGDFEILVGSSSDAIKARATLTLSADWIEPVAAGHAAAIS